MAEREYYIYRNLNDPAQCIVASERELVAGTFEQVAGPFSSRDVAEKRAVDIRAEGAEQAETE